ncbi:DUF6153 family protein [Nocardia wallacei]|nr:DUF6153 family protein [Nocardia wallacei]
MSEQPRPRSADAALGRVAGPPRPARALGYLRALGVLVLLTGVALMHAVVFAPSHAHAGPAGHTPATPTLAHTAGVAHTLGLALTHAQGHASIVGADHLDHVGETSPMPVAGQAHSAHAHAGLEQIRAGGVESIGTVAHRDPPATGDAGCADCGNAHHGLHGCVFVLVALALLLGLVMLAWVGARRPGGRLRVRLQPFAGARSPPWTVLSLPELSILRI